MIKRFGKLLNINKTNLDKIHEGPGVYGIYTQSNRLLKVGRAKRFRPAERILENAKEISTAKKFGFITTNSVKDAIKLETQLIKKRKPVLNIETHGK
jgi:excinuclease UvrABC nuclease subunit